MNQLHMKAPVQRVTGFVTWSFFALGFAVAPPLAASDSGLLDGTCSRLLWIGEDNEYALDEQVYVAEADGRDRTRLSSLSPSRILANTVRSAAWMPDGRVLWHSGGSGIVIMNADGTGLRIINNRLDDAVTAPNGRKIAIYHDGGVDVFRTNGKRIGSYVGSNRVEVTWAPTSDAMAWVEYSNFSRPLFLVVADGLAQNEVVLSSGSASSNFQWAPDGSRIAWSDDSSILLADKDGANQVVVSSGGVNPTYAWSPDSSKIALSDGATISLVDGNGSNRTLVWSNPGHSLSWSPDGSSLAWIDDSFIMVADAVGSDATAITTTAGPFEWSPDGRRIAWFDGSALRLVEIGGGAPVVLPMDADVNHGEAFSFSPDGAHFAWTANGVVGVSNADGTDVTVIDGTDPFTDIEDRTVTPLWSPDSAVFALHDFFDIAVFNADGSAHKRILSAYPSDFLEVSLRGWSPCIFTPLGPSPDNDRFANAQDLDGASEALASGSTFTVHGTTVEATTDTGEPSHRELRHGEPLGPRNSIWYRWTADVDRVVEVDMVGSEVGTVLAAYIGTAQSQLRALAMGIDNKGGVTRIRFAARRGVTYHFAVDGYGRREGAIQLNVRRPTMDRSECTITGTNGADILTGTNGADVICGLGGSDEIRGFGGPDIIFAGNGNDFVSGGGGLDMVFGEDGNDVLVGGSSADLLAGGARGDRIFGGKGDDIAFGGPGADRLFGAAGDDVLFGEMGKDRLFGGDDDDYLDGGRFNDTCVDTDGDNTVLNC